MCQNTTKQHLFFSVVFCVLSILFFTTIAFPAPLFGATTTDAINITLTVEVAAVPPVPPTGGGGPPGTPATVEIIDVESTVATDTATVLWTTNKPAISTFAWGTTTDYTQGALSEIDLTILHSAVLLDLTPDTRYFFFIEVDDLQTGRQGYAGEFTTLPLPPPPDIEPPANISDFDATPDAEDEEIDLTWENPPDEDFDLVRIVRSKDFFPLTPFEGVVVYEGRGTETVDTDVEEGVTYYYSAFAIDESGNPSEGSIDSARLLPPGVPPEEVPPLEEIPPAPPEEIPPLIEALKLFHIDFIQDGRKIPYIGLDSVPVSGGKNLIISIDYERLPEILKTVAVTVTDPEEPDKTFSFLLKVTPDKTTYRTTLSPFKRGGVYEFDVHVLDHKNQGLKKLDGKMLVAAAALAPEIEMVTTVSEFLKANICLFLLLLLLLFLLVIIYLRLFRKVDGRKLYLFLFIFLFTVIAALLFIFRVRVNEQIFCLLFYVFLFFLLLYGIYRGLKHFLAKETTEITPKE